MRTLAVATGGALLAVALLAAPVPLARSGGSWQGVLVAADTNAQVPGSVAVRDRSPAECVVVRIGARGRGAARKGAGGLGVGGLGMGRLGVGGVVLRLRDPESGIRGFRGTSVANTVVAPPGKSLPRPAALSDVRVVRPMSWSRGVAVISHVNGAGLPGSCLVAWTADGSITTRAWPDPPQVASR